MIIDNDTNEPVDYDIELPGGGSGMDELGTDGAACFSAPRFRIPAKGTMRFELSQSGTASHMFVVESASQSQNAVVLLNAPTASETVSLKATEHEGKTYYRAEIS